MERLESSKEFTAHSMELKFFHNYFGNLGGFMCDKAKEFAEKEKLPFLPSNLQVALVNLAQHEKVYFSLTFLEQKSWFARRDSLKNSYSILQSLFLSIVKQEHKVSTSGDFETDGELPENLVSTVCFQLSEFCSARLECISLYIQMFKTALAPPLDTLCEEVKLLLESYPQKFPHDCLRNIQTCISDELTALLALLQARQDIFKWNYTGAIYNLDDAHEVLLKWKPQAMKHQGSSFRGSFFGFGEKLSNPTSGLYVWMEKFFQTLKSQFTFYFYEVLCNTGSSDEMKQMLSKTSYDFVSKALLHIKRNDFSHLFLILNTREQSTTALKYGYPLPDLNDQTCVQNYRIMLTLPHTSNDHVTHIQYLLQNKTDELNLEKVVSHTSSEDNKTFFCAQIDHKIFIIIVCNGLRGDKDSNVTLYLNEVLNQLKLRKIALLLKPGNK
uniref:KICSTOR subunit 2 n=1 Tax=Ciona intestinalis TaxID=7719 RepID=F6PSG3_CIOIN|nr:KICSTOR complex protein C12orf66 homolog [Ciona intestinalis]|eukprot:XP_002131897.1 KICSTOR complex protein C12orf66 homolog [Ciona intestinalis]